jgi:ADP-ribosylglycohydrolase/Carbohydrate esterase 2 N-terminal
MRIQPTALTLIAILLPVVAGPEQVAARRLSRTVLEDKVRGGWAGQMIGVSYGAPTEFRSNGKIIEGNLNGYLDWSPKRLENAIDQDDLYVEMTFAEVMDQVGLDATSEQYGEMFKDSKYDLWHANAGARRLLSHGIKAPLSGHPKLNIHADDIDFQIESDFIGLMTPGLPREANKYADRVGRVMNWGDGLYGGMFFAGMYAAAFFESDPRKVVEIGLGSIPSDSGYARIIRDVLDWSARHPDDWTKTWQLIEDKWDRHDLCPDGALAPFNIDAKLNGAYVALGILYGKVDFAKTLEVATRAGQDSDCNPSSAAGIVGVMLGYDKIPAVWKEGIPVLADRKFAFTRYSFNEIVASTLSRAYKVIEGAGGKVTAGDVEVPAQEPQAPSLEQWEAGVPLKRVAPADPAWTWSGRWTDGTHESGGRTFGNKSAAGAGSEATFTFEGTGLSVVGHCSQEGGRADVYLDASKAGEIDAWIPERTHDNDYWHVTGLPAGKHAVRIVSRDDADARSKGKDLRLDWAIVYGTAAR